MTHKDLYQYAVGSGPTSSRSGGKRIPGGVVIWRVERIKLGFEGLFCGG